MNPQKTPGHFRPKSFLHNGLTALVLAAALLGVALRFPLPNARAAARPAADQYQALRQQAEALRAEKSYARALALYRRAAKFATTPEQKRWCAFRIADCDWRDALSSRRADASRVDTAKKALVKMVRDAATPQQKDRVWAEAEESLGDLSMRQRRNWGRRGQDAWKYYRNALDWWAGSADLRLARSRYLAIVWKAAGIHPDFPMPRRFAYYSSGPGSAIPLSVLQNALEIAKTPDDQARAHFLLARALSRRSSIRLRRRVPREFEAALALGRGSRWYDDALFEYAQWMERSGRFSVDQNGGVHWRPDYRKAVELYTRLLKEFKQGETPYWRTARRRLDAITKPRVGVTVNQTFLPKSGVRYTLTWRNLPAIQLRLHTVNLLRDVALSPGVGPYEWLNHLDLKKAELLRSWTFETGDSGDYVPGVKTMDYDGPPLAPGAYVLEARAGRLSDRALILVTDAVLVACSAPGKTLLWFADALDGRPIPGAAVRLVARRRDKSGSRNDWIVREWSGKTDANGLFVVEQKNEWRNAEWFAAADLDGRTAFAVSRFPWCELGPNAVWRLYVFTDRPAYRPKDAIHWKVVARVYDGRRYRTPAGRKIQYEIRDPRGRVAGKGVLRLNSFGAAWADQRLDEKSALGVYRINFWTAEPKRGIGGAVLCRLEEYKLPEFKVTVTVAEKNGRKPTFHPGDEITAEIHAEYYSGGPVSNAAVEVLVRKKPFSWWWRPIRLYSWYYDRLYPTPWWLRHSRGAIYKRMKLKTDAGGRVVVRIPTEGNIGRDWEYDIEARVTDASRREVRGNAAVRVTRQSYQVHIEPKPALARLGTRIHLNIKAKDANGNPVSVPGRIRIVHRRWQEVWISPSGKKLSGSALEAFRARTRIFPPQPGPNGVPWRCSSRGWTEEEILVQKIQTDAKGQADIAFTPKKTGAYDITWNSRDDDGLPIRAHAAAWVSAPDSRTLEYRVGGLTLITPGDTFRVGRTVPVLLLAQQAGRTALFTIGADRLIEYRVVRFQGTARLLEVTVTDEFTPNVFLSAVMPSNGRLFSDTKQVVVPPEKHFIDVSVTPDASACLPRGKMRFTIATRSAYDGRPVPAEVAFSVADQAVWAIQTDFAPDPRRFFFGAMRSNRIRRLNSPANFVRLVPGADGRLVDDLALAQAREKRWSPAAEGGIAGLGATAGAGGAGMLREVRASDRMFAAKAPGGMGGIMAAPPRALGVARKKRALPENAAAGILPGPAAPPAGPAVIVRSDFRATAFWKPDLHTGKTGRTTVTVPLPDSLTQWVATARAAGESARFGMGQGTVRTRLPLIVRLEMPRFAVVGDKVTLSAVVSNNTGKPQRVRAALEITGPAGSGRIEKKSRPETIPAHGQKRFDWTVTPAHPGTAAVKVSARSAEFADAMKKPWPVLEHGMEKTVVKSGKVRGGDLTVHLRIPKERRPGSAVIEVHLTPSLAVSLLDALPYLIHYPYGCTEQTMSRFLPAVIVARTLQDLGLRPADIAGRMFGGIEPEFAGATHPKGKHSLSELQAVVRRSVQRLQDFQHGDGGWGWWKTGPSDAWMTAYVVWGLALASQADMELPAGMLERGGAWLGKRLIEYESAPDTQAWMLYALAESAKAAGPRPAAGKFEQTAFDNLFRNRDKLSAYGRALLALAAHIYRRADDAAVLLRNLENGVQRDNSPDASIVLRGARHSSPAVIPTAHWGRARGWFYWYRGGVETTAFNLRALLALDPRNPLIEPVVNWLVKNRRGAQWNNTRDTAMVVLALSEYLRRSGELKHSLGWEIQANGRKIAAGRVTPATLLGVPAVVRIPAGAIRSGDNAIRIRRTAGDAPLYFSVRARFYTREEPIPPAGNQLFIRRTYYRYAGHPTLLKGWVYDRLPLHDGDRVVSGDRIEVVLTVEAKNDLEYLVFEDPKPAGLETVQLRSGGNWTARQLRSDAVHKRVDLQPGNGDHPLDLGVRDASEYTGAVRSVYCELRDRKVAMFLDRLPQGYWEIRYTLRAETPGFFHALPLVGRAMYVPEIRGNSAEFRLTVADRTAP